jgi:hypothetical protein
MAVVKEGLCACLDQVTVAYGFKEMYCDGAAQSVFPKHRPGTEHELASPHIFVAECGPLSSMQGLGSKVQD